MIEVATSSSRWPRRLRLESEQTEESAVKLKIDHHHSLLIPPISHRTNHIMTLRSFLTLNRRTLTSSAFLATFVGSILTVSAGQFLPCPARKNRDLSNQDGEIDYQDQRRQLEAQAAAEEERCGIGERVRLTGRKGWLQVEEPKGS